MYDLYQCNRDDSVRYILGRDGDRKLYVIGLNPSTANREKSDTTVAKVEKVAAANGYDGFVMANLYPLRSTEPDNLPGEHNSQLLRWNIRKIIDLASKEENPVFWAAWGVNIQIRPYMTEAFKKLNVSVTDINGSWVHYGDLLKNGHPRHPSRISYKWSFSAFDTETYQSRLA